jgi:hypothetical protein
MLVHVDVQRFTEGDNQVFLVQLCVTLNGIVLDVFGDVPQLSQCLVF